MAAFEKFKSKHGGEGPFRAFYEAATGGQGLFGRLGLREERDLTDQLISEVQNSDEFGALTPLAESGRAPMTRAEHAEFRAGILQSAMNMRTTSEAVTGFTDQQSRLRATTVGPDDVQVLDTLDTIGSYAAKLSQSGDPELRAQGVSLLADAMQKQHSYAVTNEAQRLQVEAADETDRNGQRQEIQGFVNSHIFAPLIEDNANYQAIRSQLVGEGAAVAPPSLVTAVLDYAGSALRQSDDGSWSFSFAGLGLTDQAVPTMTFSQLRNRLDQAQQGRSESMNGTLQQIGQLSQKRGFGINGTDVNDLMFPLAEAAYRQREPESKPPALTDPGTAQQAGRAAGEGVRSFFDAGGQMARTVMGLPDEFIQPDGTVVQKIDEGNGRYTWRAKPPTQVPKLPTDEQGMNRGVYVPRFLRRPSNGDP